MLKSSKESSKKSSKCMFCLRQGRKSSTHDESQCSEKHSTDAYISAKNSKNRVDLCGYCIFRRKIDKITCFSNCFHQIKYCEYYTTQQTLEYSKTMERAEEDRIFESEQIAYLNKLDKYEIECAEYHNFSNKDNTEYNKDFPAFGKPVQLKQPEQPIRPIPPDEQIRPSMESIFGQYCIECFEHREDVRENKQRERLEASSRW